MIIEKIRVKLIKHDKISQFFALLDKKKLDNLLPEAKREEVKLIINGPPCIANGIRRCIISECEVKCMDMILESFKTDDPHLRPLLIKDRLRLIPIDQKLTKINPVNFTNDSPNIQYLFSDVLTPQLGTFRVAELFAGKSVSFNCDIKVMRRHASCSLGVIEKYKCLDIFPVYTLNSKGKLLRRIITKSKARELGLVKMHTQKIICLPKLDEKNLANTNNIDFMKLIKEEYSNYKIIECDEFVDVLTLEQKTHKIVFKTYGNMTSKEILEKCIMSMRKRIEQFCSSLMENNIDIIKNSNEFYLKYDDTCTIGELLRYYSLQLNPDLEFITCKIQDPKSEIFELTMLCSEPEKVLEKTCKHIIKLLSEMLEEI